jgi:DNA-binding response OmpR family regulator
MRISLKVIGSDLFLAICKEAKQLDSIFSTLFNAEEPVEWQFSYVSGPLKPDEVLSASDWPTVLVVDAKSIESSESDQFAKKDVLEVLKQSLSTELVPIIVVFDSPAATATIKDFPEAITDWIFVPITAAELASRIYLCLKKKNILKTRLLFGSIALFPNSRVVSYSGKHIYLTPLEFALTEIFLNKTGTVISVKDIALQFKLAGRSTEGGNIRVTIYQLRLKLEMLTNSQYTLTSVYKQGYSLKAKHRSLFDLPFPNMVKAIVPKEETDAARVKTKCQ